METITQDKQFWKARCTGNFLFKQSEQKKISLEKTNWFELVENHLLTFPQKVGLSNFNLVEEFGYVKVIVYLLLMSKTGDWCYLSWNADLDSIEQVL